MTSMKIVQFSRSPTLLSIYVQNSSTLLTLEVQFQMNTPTATHHPLLNFKQKSHYLLFRDFILSYVQFSKNIMKCLFYL